jgi:glycosyltransferase involved in cell wall biosynthesis
MAPETLGGSAAHGRLPATYFFLAERAQSLLEGRVARKARVTERRLPKWLAAGVGAFLRAGRDAVQLSVWRRAVRRRAEHIIRTERIGGVLATSDDGVFLIGSYQAARATGVPFCVLLLDLYAGNRYSLVKRLLARIYEPRILRHATRVFVTNPRAQAHYRDLYGIEAVVLEHSALPALPVRPKAPRAEPVIAYTGGVYWAQADAIRNLVEALDTLPKASLDLATEQNESDLRRMDLVHGRVRIRRLTHPETTELQQSADLLFLPLSFRGRAPDLIRTAAPGKMAEYLVSGVPILVHAPADSFVSRDAREFGWGFVVDRPDPQALAEGVRTLLADNTLRERVVAKAIELANTRHNEAALAARFRLELQSAFRTTVRRTADVEPSPRGSSDPQPSDSVATPERDSYQ